MALFRTILAVFISLGLTFAPAAAALPAKAAAQYAAMAMDDCPHHRAAAATDEPCDHDGGSGKCDSAFCALKCFKAVAVFPSPAPQATFSRLPLVPALREVPVPMDWRPSTPPPRI